MHNENRDDPLASLWQQQPTPAIDVAKLKRTLKLMRVKQFLYALFDFIGVFFGLAALILLRDKMSTVFFLIMSVVIACTVIFALYLLYLRRFALFSQSQSTKDYLYVVRQQIKSNIKIARITMHSCWATVVTLAVVWCLLGIFDNMSLEVWQRKSLLSMVFAAGFCIPFWFWARARERKFRRALEVFNQQHEQP